MIGLFPSTLTLGCSMAVNVDRTPHDAMESMWLHDERL